MIHFSRVKANRLPKLKSAIRVKMGMPKRMVLPTIPTGWSAVKEDWRHQSGSAHCRACRALKRRTDRAAEFCSLPGSVHHAASGIHPIFALLFWRAAIVHAHRCGVR
jgi:hypothetical protein